jgi:molybdopterin molybdotransferase
MLSVTDAIKSLLDSGGVRPGTESISLSSSLGRCLAQDVIAAIDVPPADNSAMDGYAFRYADWQGPDVGIPLSQRITAGSVPTELTPGTAARIFTGAEVPPGADTVVMQENTDGSENGVVIRVLPKEGANIRPRGQDIKTGQTILASGHRLRPQDLGLIASQGVAEVPVYRRLKVAVLSTGNELVDPGEEIRPGQIYNSNRFSMQGQLSSWGFETVDMGVAEDDPEVIRQTFSRAADEADVILSSGGVSVGEEDHVKDVVESLGSIDLWRIAIKPGKPFAFGQVCGTPFLGLPGNPVSVFVTLLIVARPYLFSCQGLSDILPHPQLQRALFSKKGSAREDYLRVKSGPDGLELFSSQSSGILFSTSWGDGLVRQRVGEDIEEGQLVDFIPYALLN